MAGFSFGSLFGGGSGGIEHTGGSQARANPLPLNNPQQQLTTGTGQVTNTVAPPPAPAPDPLNSHLEDMANVWKTATKADGTPIGPQADPLAQPMLTFKPDDVTAAAAKLDFTASLNPELAGKALSGDAGSLLELINGAVRSAFAASTINTGNMLNQTFDRYGKAIDQALPSRLRNHEVLNRNSDDPVLSHPAVTPILKAMKQTIASQQPSMTPEQVQLAAENYVKGLGSAFNMQTEKVVEKKQVAEQTDWMKWANMDS